MHLDPADLMGSSMKGLRRTREQRTRPAMRAHFFDLEVRDDEVAWTVGTVD